MLSACGKFQKSQERGLILTSVVLLKHARRLLNIELEHDPLPIDFPSGPILLG